MNVIFWTSQQESQLAYVSPWSWHFRRPFSEGLVIDESEKKMKRWVTDELAFFFVLSALEAVMCLSVHYPCKNFARQDKFLLNLWADLVIMLFADANGRWMCWWEKFPPFGRKKRSKKVSAFRFYKITSWVELDSSLHRSLAFDGFTRIAQMGLETPWHNSRRYRNYCAVGSRSTWQYLWQESLCANTVGDFRLTT